MHPATCGRELDSRGDHLDKWLKAAVQALQVAGLRVPMAASLTPTQAVNRVQSSYRKRRNSTTDFNSVPMEKDEHADETRQGPRLRVQPSEVSGDVAGADLSSKEPQRSRREDRTSNDGLLFMAKFDPTVKVFVPHADRDHTSENKYRNTGDQGEVGENAYLFGSAMRFMPRLERNRMMRELGTERQVICRHRAPPSPPHSARGTPRSSATASAFRQRRTSPALQAPPRDPHELQSWLDERKKEILRERFGTQQPTSQLRRASGILLSPRERAMMRAESKASSREMVEFTPHLTPRRVVSVAKQVPKVPRRPHGGSAARTEGPRVAPKSPRGGPSHPNAPASHSHGFGYARHISPTASTAKDTESKDIVLSARKVASENPDVSAVSRALGAPDTADRGNRKPTRLYTMYFLERRAQTPLTGSLSAL